MVFFESAENGERNFEMCRKNSFSKLSGIIAPRSMAGTYTDETKPILESQKTRVFNLMPAYTPTDIITIQKSIINHMEYTLARTRFNFTEEDLYRAAAFSTRDRLIETLNDTKAYFFEKDFKRCYYLSLEFLVGRAMQNATCCLDVEDSYKKACAELGYNLEALYEYEHEAALGNGGLGRLAACFLDSMATLNYPCWGYGIRYTYGIFEQKIVNGRQVEHPDYWLVQDNPWEIPRHDITYGVRFYGTVNQTTGQNGKINYKWTGGKVVQAVAYDNPIPGFDSANCINLRLWKSAPSREFDFTSFNEGKYLDSVAERQDAECISAVLYPNDSSEEGKTLRLKQQYFFCCATIQDVLRRFKLKTNRQWTDLPNKISIQLNDTHPAIAVPELMRILIDIEGLEWDFAWNLTRGVFNYTNHTVLPEALEKWPADLLGRLLPRHLLIINEINMHFLNDVRNVLGDVPRKIMRMSIYEESFPKMLKMANLAVIGSNKVNGVAKIHTDIVRRDLFADFVEYYKRSGQPDKFINITNGVTPRRWIHCANRPLSNLMSGWLGSDQWLKDFSLIEGLLPFVNEQKLITEWRRVKLKNKRRLAEHLHKLVGIVVDYESMLFDVQIKRIHEYKRQAMNCFYIIHRYLTLKKMSPEQRKHVVPRLSLIGGKAAPNYQTAKSIIHMVNNLASIINNDPDVSSYLKVVFLPNYNVSQAMVIIPAADTNQQISTAGTEASGTSNMKLVMNGSLIIGTMDGANVEICEETGRDTMFIFGAAEHEVEKIRANARNGNYPIDERLKEIFNWIKSGNLSCGDKDAQNQFSTFVNNILNNGNGHNGDFYLLIHDFPSYVKAHEAADQAYKNQNEWTKTCIKAAASMGRFSTDRTIQEYAKKIWNLQEAERPTAWHQKSISTSKEIKQEVKANNKTDSKTNTRTDVKANIKATQSATVTTPITTPSTPVSSTVVQAK